MSQSSWDSILGVENHLAMMKYISWAAMFLSACAVVWYQWHTQKWEGRLTALKSDKAAREEKVRADKEELRADLAEGQLHTIISALERANQQLAEQQRRRRLTPNQKEAIKKAISLFAGQKVSVWYPTGDAESSQYAADFMDLLEESGWICERLNSRNYPTVFENLLVAVSMDVGVDKELPMPPQAYYNLVRVLMDLGLTDNGGEDPLTKFHKVGQIKGNEINIRIGAKLGPVDPVVSEQSK